MSDYITPTMLKATLDRTGTTYADGDIATAISAASVAIDEACGRPYGFTATTGATAIYTPDNYSGLGFYPYGLTYANILEIDDLSALTSVTVDMDGDGVYETTWTQGQQFYLDPPNNPNINKPWERLVLRWQNGARFPSYDNSVQVVGTFGWTTTPPEVTQYCTILAAQLVMRVRQAPFGVVTAGMEIGSTTRVSRFDPDFERLLGKLIKPRRLIA